jgi:hypothetical protein
MASDASYMGTRTPITRPLMEFRRRKSSADPTTIAVGMNGTKDRHVV